MGQRPHLQKESIDPHTIETLLQDAGLETSRQAHTLMHRERQHEGRNNKHISKQKIHQELQVAKKIR